ncbi:GHMP family kinase ATP-binding protein [Tindallia californiensis]|uniref:Threonine kinase n=1 Tax=Tindallia californiensis TaxID=159292 RepID=A0A1H3PIV5_9FIRM|nr:hypothetical protein [Tindallia californiensis]SDZ01056.1 threonine kinase [Tindallia californiensis]
MKQIISACPGSCGEWMQGWMQGGEKLISYAIDRFSRVRLEETGNGLEDHQWLKRHRPRAFQMMGLIFEEVKASEKDRRSFRLKLESPLPLAKGMASSTADLAAVADGVARWFGMNLTPEKLTELCVQLEPTDSIIHPKTCLMDPLTGEVSVYFEQEPPPLELLILEGKKGIATASSRKPDHFEKRKAYEKEMEKALTLFQKGIREKNPSLLAKAAWISAMGNEAFYPQPGLREIRDLALESGGLGLNVSHSGSTLGLLFEPEALDEERFSKGWQVLSCRHHYEPPRRHQMIAGGIRREK